MKRTRFDILSRGLRRERGVMNGNEKAYSLYLDADPDVFHWVFEPLSLRLSHPEAGIGARYTPDFLVLYSDGTTCLDDVKSGGFDDKASVVRVKAAAEMFSLWKFRLVNRIPKKAGGGWKVVEV